MVESIFDLNHECSSLECIDCDWNDSSVSEVIENGCSIVHC